MDIHSVDIHNVCDVARLDTYLCVRTIPIQYGQHRYFVFRNFLLLFFRFNLLIAFVCNVFKSPYYSYTP